MMETRNVLSAIEQKVVLAKLKERFEQHHHRHSNIIWHRLEEKLLDNLYKLWSLSQMEKTGGEPDVIGYDDKTGEYNFVDCSPESPVGRRSLCYDNEALKSRKKNKPKGSAVDMVQSLGIELLTEEQYRYLQTVGNFDTKTSSWLQTPEKIRKLGGAIFADRRYNTVFVYHNGAESYYASRGFRGCLRV